MGFRPPVNHIDNSEVRGQETDEDAVDDKDDTRTHTHRKAEQHTPQTVGLGGLMDQTQKLWRTGLFCGRWVQRSKPVACDWPVQSRAPPLRHQHHPHQFLFFIFHFPPPPIIVYTVIEYNSLHSNPLSQNVVFCI